MPNAYLRAITLVDRPLVTWPNCLVSRNNTRTAQSTVKQIHTLFVTVRSAGTDLVVKTFKNLFWRNLCDVKPSNMECLSTFGLVTLNEDRPCCARFKEMT